MGIISLTAFDRLQQALELAESNRINASRSVWNELPEDFRQQVMKFAIFCLKNPSELGCSVHMRCPHGDFVLDDRLVSRLKTVLPRIISVNS